MKRKLFLLGVIAVIVSLCVICGIVEQRTLSEYMISCGQNKVYIPNGIADSYFNSNFGTKAWMFHLNDFEAKEAMKYINDFPEEWRELDNNAFSFIMYKFVDNDKIDLLKLSDDCVYYSLIDLFNLEFITPHETIPDKYAVFIWDSTQSNYYCIKMNER